MINIAELKNKNYAYIEQEMKALVQICRENNVISKVIFENCYLEDGEIIELCRIANKYKPDYIKTSTGFGTSGATVKDVQLMRKHALPEIGIKAAGGIRDLATVNKMLAAGATRIGCSSSVQIMEEKRQEQ